MRLACVLGFLVAASTIAGADEKHYPYERPPGPIGGRWKVTCADMDGLILDFKVDGPNAVGSVASLGKGGIRNYRAGEQIIHVQVDEFGQWYGKLVWRSVSGASHEDSIRLVATQDTLDAVMTTDDCYKSMPRAH
jgi:hypothetical protein